MTTPPSFSETLDRILGDVLGSLRSACAAAGIDTLAATVDTYENGWFFVTDVDGIDETVADRIMTALADLSHVLHGEFFLHSTLTVTADTATLDGNQVRA